MPAGKYISRDDLASFAEAASMSDTLSHVPVRPASALESPGLNRVPDAGRGSGFDAEAAPEDFGPMPRVTAIWNHPQFQRELQRLNDLERDRMFCRHGLPHLLDVARIAWILCLEDDLGLDRELVYAAALLHDIGKAEQYLKGTPHEAAGEKIASEILATFDADIFMTVSEARAVLRAVRGHRHLRQDAEPLEELIYRADKRSRMCFACPVADRCNWPAEKRIRFIER